MSELARTVSPGAGGRRRAMEDRGLTRETVPHSVALCVLVETLWNQRCVHYVYMAGGLRRHHARPS
ncbi:MAG TPA: hypothetical protein VGO40_15435, partial [Longimicrobium sp.]|nr:hypothetical protein [Longimicrobium sp.]